MKWRERPPDTAVTFIWKESCSERVISRDGYTKVRVFGTVVEEDLEFLLDGCFLGGWEKDGVIVAAAGAGAAKGVCFC